MVNKTGYDELIRMLKFVNKSKEPVARSKLDKFGLLGNEIDIFQDDSVLVSISVNGKCDYKLSSEGYKLLQDHWHIQASKQSTGVMFFLGVVGLLLSGIMVIQNINKIHISVTIVTLAVFLGFIMGFAIRGLFWK